jgi:shikimate dehydrogenase
MRSEMALDERVGGKTIILGLVGNPVEHSVSPQLHNSLSSRLGIDAVYIPFKADKDCLGDVVKGFKAAGIKGFNVTIPFKEEIIRHIDVCNDEVKIIGSANTVRVAEGLTYAFNTDAEGFARSFEQQTGMLFRDKRVLLLGAGGTARSIALRIASRGARKIIISNRTIERAADIASMVSANSSVETEISSVVSLADQTFISSFDIIINTTSLGMYPEVEDSPLSDSLRLNGEQVVYDVIYNPARTKLLRQAESFGCKAVNGMGMLFWQGILAYEIWMDIKVSDEVTSSLWVDFLNYFDK